MRGTAMAQVGLEPDLHEVGPQVGAAKCALEHLRGAHHNDP
jgi:hypothetical protein